MRSSEPKRGSRRVVASFQRVKKPTMTRRGGWPHDTADLGSKG